ncbi:MAG: hypothetical protein ACR2FJ_09320 [Qipengyuania sp.]
MTEAISQELPETTRLALTFARRRDRTLFASLFALDARLARIVSATREILLGQMRLAWWRDRMREPAQQWPVGDVVLDSIAQAWDGKSQDLVQLIDGWETMLVDENTQGTADSGLGEGRARAMEALAHRAESCSKPEEITLAATRWSLVDLAQNSSTPPLAAAALAKARTLPDRAASLDRAMRPLAVLDGLARRALERDLPVMLGDRMSPLVALRLGIFGA